MGYKRIILLLTAVLCMNCNLLACTTENTGSDSEILSIYNDYVVTAQNNGVTPLSYQDWLKNIKGNFEQVIVNSDEQIVVSTVSELKLMVSDGVSIIKLKKDVEFEISETLFLSENTIIQGNNATIKRATGFEDKLISMGANCRVQDLKIDGNRGAMVSPTWDKTIEIATSANCIVENVTINNANEAIVVYGNDVIVKGCKLYNCGGNGIHFSGAERTRVEDCVVIGANKRNDMGHEDGCIIWSNECNYTICENNYCEDGKSGFGSIDYGGNSNLKIIGNTVVNCAVAIEAEKPTIELEPYEIIFANNHFINSGKVQISCSDNINVSISKFIFLGNILEETSLQIDDARGAIVESNIIKHSNETAISMSNAKDVVISNNKIYSMSNVCIYGNENDTITIKGNIIDTIAVGIQLDASKHVIVEGNIINQSVIANTNGFVINVGDAIIANNQLTIYSGAGILVRDNSNCTSNQIVCDDIALVAIKVYGGTKNYIVNENISNGVYEISEGETGYVDNNLNIIDERNNV